MQCSWSRSSNVLNILILSNGFIDLKQPQFSSTEYLLCSVVLDQLKERAKKSQDTLEDEKLFWKICSSSYQELLQHYINYNYDTASEVDK